MLSVRATCLRALIRAWFSESQRRTKSYSRTKTCTSDSAENGSALRADRQNRGVRNVNALRNRGPDEEHGQASALILVAVFRYVMRSVHFKVFHSL